MYLSGRCAIAFLCLIFAILALKNFLRTLYYLSYYFKNLFKIQGGRLGLRRPASGICQFCLKIISAANWSRHLQSMHLEEISEMRKGGEVLKKFFSLVVI